MQAITNLEWDGLTEEAAKNLVDNYDFIYMKDRKPTKENKLILLWTGTDYHPSMNIGDGTIIMGAMRYPLAAFTVWKPFEAVTYELKMSTEAGNYIERLRPTNQKYETGVKTVLAIGHGDDKDGIFVEWLGKGKIVVRIGGIDHKQTIEEFVNNCK
jgi:hypothetical protein